MKVVYSREEDLFRYKIILISKDGTVFYNANSLSDIIERLGELNLSYYIEITINDNIKGSKVIFNKDVYDDVF